MQVLDLPHSDVGPRDGRAVLLLHGFPLTHRMWDAQATALKQAGFRVIVPDLRGAGQAPVTQSATMAEMAADVLRLCDRSALRSFVVVGFSMGGYVALEMARQAPERIEALGLIDTRAEPDSPEAAQGRGATADRVRLEGMRVLAEAMMPKLLTPETVSQRPSIAEAVERMILENPPEGAAQALLGMARRADSRPLLPSLRVPALVVVGARDPVTPPDAAQALVAGLPDARLEVVADAAHLTPMERPDVVNAALLAWLATIR